MATQRISTKWQLVLFSWAITGLLGFYTLGSLWEYADTLKASNGWMLKVGFCADLAAIAIWTWFHVFRKWRVTRIWCLFAATAMGIFLVVHAAAITKYVAAKKEATENVTALANGLQGITEASTAGVVSGTSQVASKLRQQGAPNSARGAIRDGQNAAASVGVQNGKTLAEATAKMEDQARSSTFLSVDYMNGKMFAVIYIALLVLAGITLLVFELGKAEEDDDDDGIPNFADADSSYYDAKRAEKWWKDRGQLAPHQLPQSQPAQLPTAPTQAPQFGFAQAAPKPNATPTEKKSLFRKLWGESPKPPSNF